MSGANEIITVVLQHDAADAVVLALLFDMQSAAAELAELSATTTPGDVYRIEAKAGEIAGRRNLLLQLSLGEYRADRSITADEPTMVELAQRLNYYARDFARGARVDDDDDEPVRREAEESAATAAHLLATSRSIAQLVGELAGEGATA